jgi:hypothetical protein
MLIVPDKTTLSAVQPAGPLAIRLGWPARLSDHCIRVENPTNTDCNILCSLTPLCDQYGGQLPAEFQLRTHNQTITGPVCIAAKSSCTIRFMPAGEFVLSPGQYNARLDIADEGGTEVQSIRISLQVRAHWGWALALILLGLMIVGGITLLAEEGKVKKQVTRLMALQEGAHELAEKYAMEAVTAGLSGDIDNALQQALSALNRPRPPGVVDWRMDRADRFEQVAQKKIDQLRALAKKGTPGKIALEHLDARWQEIGRRIIGLGQQGDKPASESEEEGAAAAWLARFLDWAKRISIEPLVRVIEEQLGPHVQRTQWTLLAGEDDRAARMAAKVQFLLERAAAELRQALDLQLTWKINGQYMVRLYQNLERAVKEENYTTWQRAKLSTILEPARLIFADEPSLTGIRDANAAIQTAATQAFQFSSDHILEAVRGVIKEVEGQAGIGPITDFMDGLHAADSLKQKQQNLLTIVRLWREWTTAQPESESLNEILATIERLENYTQNNETELLTAAMQKLIAQWQTYHAIAVTAALSTVLRPYCRNIKTYLIAELQVAFQTQRLLEPHPGVAGLDKTLDSLDRQIQLTPLDHSCLSKLTELGLQSQQVGEEMFLTLLQVADIPDQARLDSAERSADQRAIAFARNLMAEPWPVHLVVLTLPEEQHVEREITFQVDNLKTGWQQDIELTIDFGDGTLETDHAESLRKRGILTHRYEQPGSYVVEIRALGRDSVTGATDIIGQTKLNLLVKQSPLSNAQRVAGAFFNLRFLLALGIALLIGTWRFAGNPLFGADKDYLEAFVVGFSTNLGIEGLASWTAKTVM